MILFCIGTRPEYIKIKPLLDKISKDKYKTVFTGQHVNLLSNVEFDYNISIKDETNRLDSIVKSILGNDNIFENIKYVLIQGDTTSALSMALAAFHRNIKIIHLEAGLRTYDFQNPYPEEMNRQLISRLSYIHLCPTLQNKNNLLKENISKKVYVTGNTGLDSIVKYKNQVTYDSNVLITLHRRENHNIMDKWFSVLNNIAKEYSDINFLLPIHPNPNVLKYKNLLKYVKVCEPMSHSELLNYLITCKLVISDSGGLQEECSFLNKKILICRNTTERPESLKISSFLCTPENLYENFKIHINSYNINNDCPFGKGFSSDIILKLLKYEKII